MRGKDEPARQSGLLPWVLVAVAMILFSCCGGVIIVGVLSFGWTNSPSGQSSEETIPFQTFRAIRPQESARFRLRAKLSNYYNYAYRAMDTTHYSVELTEPFGSSDLHGYIRKDSEDGKKIFDILKDGKEHVIRVELQSAGPRGEHLGPADGGDVVAIKQLLD